MSFPGFGPVKVPCSPVAVSVRRQAGTRLGQVIGEYIHMINYWPTVVTFWQEKIENSDNLNFVGQFR